LFIIPFEELNELIEEGLTLLGAVKHLELFQQQCKKSQIDEFGKTRFFKSKFEGVNPIRDLMNSDTLRNRREFSTIECRF
jgi:hypothetical protein